MASSTRRVWRHAACSTLRLFLAAVLASASVTPPAHSQSTDPDTGAAIGEAVPFDVREMYTRGVRFLADKQTENGDWPGSYRGAGSTGMGVMVFLATGEDPNFGAYSENLRRALRRLISQQDAETGFLGENMYHHGFGMLALAEAYGLVDDRGLWRGVPNTTNRRSVGEALELAVRCAITSQESNPFGAWRYGPEDRSADTSVTGAVLMGLLGARNAGLAVPDRSINKAIGFINEMTTDEGMVAYATGISSAISDSVARTAIAALVCSIAGREYLPMHRATLDRLQKGIEGDGEAEYYKQYADYYQAQALFQGDTRAWGEWNKKLVSRLKGKQRPDGSFEGQLGPEVATSLSLLALAVNYRLLPIYERR